jgi:hypothetical protein
MHSEAAQRNAFVAGIRGQAHPVGPAGRDEDRVIRRRERVAARAVVKRERARERQHQHVQALALDPA